MDQPADSSLNPKVEVLISNITQLMDEAEDMLRDSTSQHAEYELQLLRTRCHNLQARLTAFCTTAGRAIADGARRTDQIVREHPYESLAIALGAGLVAGVVIGRRR